jgi:hypothetical protein
MIMYLVSVMDPNDAHWFEVEAPSAELAIQAVISRFFEDDPPAGVEISAIPKPDGPIKIERLADMSEFEAEFREDPN